MVWPFPPFPWAPLPSFQDFPFQIPNPAGFKISLDTCRLDLGMDGQGPGYGPLGMGNPWN